MTDTLTTSPPVFASESQVGEESVDVSAFRPPLESQTSLPEMTGIEITLEGRRVLAGRQWLGGGDLIRPIRVHIDGTADGLTASEPQTGIFGMGQDLPSALQDLRTALREHLEVLESSGALSEDLQRQLTFLRRHVRAA
jgi:hypothetical protein